MWRRAIFCVILLSGSARALDFDAIRIAPDLVVMSATGSIEHGDDAVLRRHLRAHAGRDVILMIDSEGGLLRAAVELAELVERYRVSVAVPDGAICASACFLVLAASPERSAGATARIGVHSVSVNARETNSALAMTTLFARLAREYGVPDSILGRLVTTLPDEMAWLDARDLRAMRIRLLPAAGSSGASLPRAPAPVAAPRVPPARPAQPPDSRPGVPPEQLSGESPAFGRGLADRTGWEAWVTGLPNPARAGAEFWAAQRSMPNPLACPAIPPETFTGCEEAKRRLATHDAQRRADPDYRRGWNAFLPLAYRARVIDALRACRARGLTPAILPRFETVRDINGDGIADYILDFEAFRCGGETPPECGVAGCMIEVYVSAPTGHRRVLRRPVAAWQSAPAVPNLLSVTLQGAECRPGEGRPCRRQLRWDGSGFAE